MIQALKPVNTGQGNKNEPAPSSYPLRGDIRFKTDRFKFGGFTWHPLQAHIALKDDRTEINLDEALLCGIAMPGVIQLTPSTIAFDVEPFAEEQELEPSKTCLVGETVRADGRYQLKGRIQGKGNPEHLLEATTSQLEIAGVNGRIYHNFVLLKVLKFLNTQSILTGRMPVADMEKKGFEYYSYHIKTRIQNAKILIDEAVLKGAPLTLIASGKYDLKSEQLDLNLLATPLVFQDPLSGGLAWLQGAIESLIAIPMGLTGTSDNIQIYPLAPSAIGVDLKTLMKKTIETPITIFDPVHG